LSEANRRNPLRNKFHLIKQTKPLAGEAIQLDCLALDMLTGLVNGGYFSPIRSRNQGPPLPFSIPNSYVTGPLEISKHSLSHPMSISCSLTTKSLDGKGNIGDHSSTQQGFELIIYLLLQMTFSRETNRVRHPKTWITSNFLLSSGYLPTWPRGVCSGN